MNQIPVIKSQSCCGGMDVFLTPYEIRDLKLGD